MIDLLPLTLEGNEPVEWQVKPRSCAGAGRGRGAGAHAAAAYRRAMVMSAGCTATKPRRSNCSISWSATC